MHSLGRRKRRAKAPSLDASGQAACGKKEEADISLQGPASHEAHTGPAAWGPTTARLQSGELIGKPSFSSRPHPRHSDTGERSQETNLRGADQGSRWSQTGCSRFRGHPTCLAIGSRGGRRLFPRMREDGEFPLSAITGSMACFGRHGLRRMLCV